MVRKAIQYRMNSNGPRMAQVLSIHWTSCWSGWPRGLGDLNPSPISWIFTSVSVDSSPRSYLFNSTTVRIGVLTAPKYVPNPIRNVTIHFRDLRGVALRQRNCAEITVLGSEQEPYPVWFSCGAKATRYGVNIALDETNRRACCKTFFPLLNAINVFNLS